MMRRVRGGAASFVGTTGLAGNGDFRTEEGLLGCIYKIEVKKVSDDP